MVSDSAGIKVCQENSLTFYRLNLREERDEGASETLAMREAKVITGKDVKVKSVE